MQKTFSCICLKPHQLDMLSNLVLFLSQITDWLSNNDLVLHSNKTEVMIMAPPEKLLRMSAVIASFCSSANSSVHNLSEIFDHIPLFLSLRGHSFGSYSLFP